MLPELKVLRLFSLPVVCRQDNWLWAAKAKVNLSVLAIEFCLRYSNSANCHEFRVNVESFVVVPLLSLPFSMSAKTSVLISVSDLCSLEIEQGDQAGDGFASYIRLFS